MAQVGWAVRLAMARRSALACPVQTGTMKRQMERTSTHGDKASAGAEPLRSWRRGWPALAVWLALVLAARAASLSVSLDRNVVTLGETATLSLAFEGGEPAAVPTWPDVPNLQISFLGPSRQLSIINNQVSSTVTYNYTVTARQPGDYVIPALRVQVGAQWLASQPVVLRVVAPDPRAQLAFLRLHLLKSEVYLGEVLPVELRLYLRDVVVGYGNVQWPALKADGFTVLRNARLPDRQERTADGLFTVVAVAYALVPARVGELAIGPADCTLVVELPLSRARRRDPFADLGFGLFRNTEQKSVAVAAEAQTVRVLPLPADNVPPGFNGAVGQYRLSLSAGPTNVAVGDPITVKVQLTGSGALEALDLPTPAGWQQFKVYPPTAAVQTTDLLGTQGTKTFEQVVVPQSADIVELPPLTFAFFDPEAKAYRTLSHPGVKLTVRPSSPTPAPVVAGTASAAENTPPPRDIVGLKQRPGALALVRPPLALRPSFWAWNAVPALAWLGALLWRSRADVLARNPRLRRQREVARRVREGLAELRRLAAANQADAFFATLFRLLQEQIGERLDVPASAITEAVVEERLKPAGLPADTCAALHELFQVCNLARYAPARSSQELAALVPRLEAALTQLREWSP